MDPTFPLKSPFPLEVNITLLAASPCSFFFRPATVLAHGRARGNAEVRRRVQAMSDIEEKSIHATQSGIAYGSSKDINATPKLDI